VPAAPQHPRPVALLCVHGDAPRVKRARAVLLIRALAVRRGPATVTR
jgi:hypothetical protein